MNISIPFNSIVIFLTMTILTSAIQAQSIKGNGNVKKDIRNVSSFDKIKIDGVFNVIISQGENEKVVVEADENLIPYVLTKTEDGVLKISTKPKTNVEKSEKMNVYVTIKNIDNIEFSGVGNLKTEGKISLDELLLENNGVGNFDIGLNCNKLKLKNNSVGNSTLSGKADEVDIENNSVGNIYAFDLVAGKLKIISNSVGNAEVNSDKELYITQNGMGNISYKGSAEIKSLIKNGMGNIRKY